MDFDTIPISYWSCLFQMFWTLTLPYTSCFWSFHHNLHSSNTIEILKHFLGLGHSGHPCDQIHMGIGPNHALHSELWGSKVGRWGHYDPTPWKVGLTGLLGPPVWWVASNARVIMNNCRAPHGTRAMVRVEQQTGAVVGALVKTQLEAQLLFVSSHNQTLRDNNSFSIHFRTF